MNKLLLPLLLAFCMCIHAESLTNAVTPLDSTTIALDDVVVTGTRYATDIRHLPMTVTVIGRETLTKQHHTNVLPTIMEEVPGVFVTSRAMMGYGVSNGAAGSINLRGITGGAGQLLVLIDGHPQYQGVYGHPIADSYQTLMAERVELLRGPASVLYGSNAMGGVLNIVTRSMKHDGMRTTFDVGAGSYGTVQGEASHQLRRGKFSSTISAQYNRTDNHRPRMGFEQYGGYLKFGYDFTPHWKANVDANLTHFNASHPGTVDAPVYGADQWITRGVVSAAIENHYQLTSGALSVYTNFGRHKIDDGSAKASQPTNRYFRSKDALAGISWYQSAQLFDGNRLTVGIDFQHIYGKAYYTAKDTGEEMIVKNKQSGRSYRNEIASYVDFRQELLSWLTVDVGLRVDHHSVSGTEWVPQAGIVIRPLQTGEIKAMVSKGFRNPTMRELYLYPPSNEELKAERLWNYELSWRHRTGTFQYGANVFLIKGDNMIQTINFKNVNTGEVENYGVELEGSYQMDNHWRIHSNHALLHMKNPVVAAPTYKGFLGADYRHQRLSASAGLHYIHGLYTAVGNIESKEHFCLLNASVSYLVVKNLSLWLRGENLLAQRYEINRGYPMPRATFMAGIKVML